MVLKFLLDRAPLDRHPGFGCIASALVAHLRTVRALELTLEVWKVGLSSLVKAEQAQKLHIVRKIEDLLRVMVRESQDIKSRHLLAFITGYLSGLEKCTMSASEKSIFGCP